MNRIGRVLTRQWPMLLVVVGLTGVISMIFWLAAQAAQNHDDITALQRQLNTAVAEKDATADALGQANADRVAAGQEPIVPEPVQGPAGAGIATITRDPDTCVLTVTLTEGTVIDLGDVCGRPGADGKPGTPGTDGRGIADVQVVDCTLVVTYTDDTTQNAGSVCAAAPTSSGSGPETPGEENS